MNPAAYCLLANSLSGSSQSVTSLNGFYLKMSLG